MSKGLSIVATRPDALAMFRTWLADRALIRIEFRFRLFAATFRARVITVAEASVAFMADDRLAELVLPLPPDVRFRFLDLRGFPEEKDFERMLVMFYPVGPDPDKWDQIVFAEVREH